MDVMWRSYEVLGKFDGGSREVLGGSREVLGGSKEVVGSTQMWDRP